MFLVFGLGNPGKEYSNTRHNIGFQILDSIASSYRFTIRHYACKSLYGSLSKNVEEEIIFIKPQTFMNLSGDAVQDCLLKFKVPLDKILIIHDDLDLCFGSLRLKKGGSAGGHKGIKSTIDRTGSSDFYRLKIGIGRPESSLDVIDYVLEPFTCSERKELPDIIQKAIQATFDFIGYGFNYAANKHNES